MSRDHMMGFPSVAEAAADVAEEGEFYFSDGCAWGPDPHPLGRPSSRIQEAQDRHRDWALEVNKIASFNRGEHTPDPAVYFRTYAEEAKRRDVQGSAILAGRRPVEVRTALPQVPALFKPAPKVTPEPDAEMQAARAAALEYAQAHAKRWDLYTTPTAVECNARAEANQRWAALQAAQAKRRERDNAVALLTPEARAYLGDNTLSTQMGNLPTYYANTPPTLAQCMGTLEIRVVVDGPDEPIF